MLVWSAGVPKVEITRAMAHLQSITESGAEVNEMEAAPKLDYSTENRPLNWIPEHDVSDKYHFISEISRFVHAFRIAKQIWDITGKGLHNVIHSNACFAGGVSQL